MTSGGLPLPTLRPEAGQNHRKPTCDQKNGNQRDLGLGELPDATKQKAGAHDEPKPFHAQPESSARHLPAQGDESDDCEGPAGLDGGEQHDSDPDKKAPHPVASIFLPIFRSFSSVTSRSASSAIKTSSSLYLIRFKECISS